MGFALNFVGVTLCSLTQKIASFRPSVFTSVWRRRGRELLDTLWISNGIACKRPKRLERRATKKKIQWARIHTRTTCEMRRARDIFIYLFWGRKATPSMAHEAIRYKHNVNNMNSIFILSLPFSFPWHGSFVTTISIVYTIWFNKLVGVAVAEPKLLCTHLYSFSRNRSLIHSVCVDYGNDIFSLSNLLAIFFLPIRFSHCVHEFIEHVCENWIDSKPKKNQPSYGNWANIHQNFAQLAEWMTNICILCQR